jgi:hypothetical protein
VPENALERVVQLVRNTGDELSEGGELLRLHQPVAQLGALGLQCACAVTSARRGRRRSIRLLIHQPRQR